MGTGAAVSTVPLIKALADIGDIKAYHIAPSGNRLTVAQIIQRRPLTITVATVIGLIGPALWLWMARSYGQGRNWARTLSMVLFVLATSPAVLGRISACVALVPIAALTWLAAWLWVWLSRRLVPAARSSSRRTSRRPGPAYSRLRWVPLL